MDCFHLPLPFGKVRSSLKVHPCKSFFADFPKNAGKVDF